MYTRSRLPDPVRSAAVRALVIVAVTLVQLMIAVLCSLAQVWLAFPMVISTVVSTVVATWAVLDVWVTRQVWRQRHGVLSEPSSAARQRAMEKARTRARRGRDG
jgi:membrane protein YdbS with pleckstrin-like domain